MALLLFRIEEVVPGCCCRCLRQSYVFMGVRVGVVCHLGSGSEVMVEVSSDRGVVGCKVVVRSWYRVRRPEVSSDDA